MIEALNHLLDEVQKRFEHAQSIQELRDIEIAYLGRKGKLATLLSELASLPPDKKPLAGQRANEVKRELTQAFERRRDILKGVQTPTVEQRDVTWPGEEVRRGHLHPITQFMRRVVDTFVSMGFDVLEGPEVELPKYNFDLLNIPPDHPARDAWDTFFVRAPGSRSKGEAQLMRTHTSPMQIRAMEKRRPPIRLIVPGRVFRHEATDASHEATFYQCEGLVIDKGICLTDLIGTLKDFLQGLYGKGVRIRVRPEYYPFVEPGMDVDMSCLLCGGKGCSACKQSGWMEMMGSGMVHPTVLKNMRVDPEKYSGFAFGLGIDRLMMLYYRIGDIRLSYGGDLRFLRQF